MNDKFKSWRTAFKGYSRDALIHVRHSKVSSSAEHIAAVQELDARDQEQKQNLLEQKIANAQADQGKNEPMAEFPPDEKSLDVFISHSSKDAHIALALIELIRAALDVPHGRIRCTSAEGYLLPIGTNVDDQLKCEVRDSRAFIGLLTPNSLESKYVLFELGARWGAQLRLFPIVAGGTKASDLRSPLSSLMTLDCYTPGKVHHLITELGALLSKPTNPPATYQRHLQALIDTALPKQTEQPTTDENTEAKVTPPKTQAGKELLELIQREPNVNERGIVEIQKEVRPGITFFFPKLQYAGNPLSIKSREFREGINELLANHWFYPPQENPSTNTRTYEYRGN